MMALNKIMMELVFLMINTLVMLTKSSSIALLVKKCLIMLGRDITAAYLLTDRQDQENLIR